MWWIQLIILLFGHWVADFVLQPRSWAQAKSHSNVALGKHVAVYTVGMYMTVFVLGFPLAMSLQFAAINGVAHFIIDYCTSRLTTKFYYDGKFHAFFTTIGFDQWLHYLVMFASLGMIGYTP